MVKRAFDVLLCVPGLVILSPVLLLIGLFVRLTSPGPALYRATRSGRGGTPFTLYKFRSMVSGADQQGPGITGAGDARVTAIGRILRRTKLDELPQLVNVVRGDMSLVGPRPEDPRYVALYTPEQRQVLSVRPGITSQASVDYRHEEALLTEADREKQYVEVLMPAKLAIDLDYVQHPGLRRDLAIFWRTLVAIFR